MCVFGESKFHFPIGKVKLFRENYVRINVQVPKALKTGDFTGHHQKVGSKSFRTCKTKPIRPEHRRPDFSVQKNFPTGTLLIK